MLSSMMQPNGRTWTATATATITPTIHGPTETLRGPANTEPMWYSKTPVQPKKVRRAQNGLPDAQTKTATDGTTSKTPFPNDPTQWSDMDGDGYGDNASGTDADQCPDVAGTSTVDRLGCEDTDGDGYSDPDPNTNWLPEQGADAFPNEPTQWADQDHSMATIQPVTVQMTARP